MTREPSVQLLSCDPLQESEIQLLTDKKYLICTGRISGNVKINHGETTRSGPVRRLLFYKQSGGAATTSGN